MPIGSEDQSTPEPTAGRGGGRRRRRLRNLLLVLLLLPPLGLALVAGAVWAATDVPQPEDVWQPQVSVVTWSDGSEMARVGAENRIQVPLSAVSEAAQEAVIAAEDRTFRENKGVSPKAILRALWANVRSGEVEQGGSTITQQYAKNAFLSSERTLSRKVQEAVIAVKLEQSYTKDQVLEYYLNTVYFGRGAYGIETAAQTYFGRSASELDAAQGAVLAVALRAPSTYDPERNPELARDRWRYVLEGMAEAGALAQPVAAIDYPKVLPRRDRDSLGGPTGYLVTQALEEAERKGIPESRVRVSGLQIRTTIDKEAQAEAVRAVRKVSGKKAPKGVHRALVSVQPGTGRILAEYGGPDYVKRQFNSATQGRAQAGSSFKPYVLAAALMKNTSLRDRYDGSSPQRFGPDGYYKVKNFGSGDGVDYGKISVLKATANSVNTVYVPLGLDAGLGNVADTASELGITTDMSEQRDLPSLSLGVTAVSPLDQAVAYATFAARGVRADPYMVERVTAPDGTVLHQAEPVTKRVLPKGVADDVTFALRKVVTDGSGEAAQLPKRPAAGKTGTTSGNTAAWFVGYTPRMATAVALFSERRDRPLRGIAGVREVTGGSLPAKTWKTYTRAVLKDESVKRFPAPNWVNAEKNKAKPSPSAVERTPTSRPTRSTTPKSTPSPSATKKKKTASPSSTPTKRPPRKSSPPPLTADPVPDAIEPSNPVTRPSRTPKKRSSDSSTDGDSTSGSTSSSRSSSTAEPEPSGSGTGGADP